MRIPMGGKPGKIGKAVEGINATGRHGGKLVKAAAGPGHQKQAMTPVQTDRGAFKVKG